MRRKPTNFSSRVTQVVSQKGKVYDKLQNAFTSLINTLENLSQQQKATSPSATPSDPFSFTLPRGEAC